MRHYRHHKRSMHVVEPTVLVIYFCHWLPAVIQTLRDVMASIPSCSAKFDFTSLAGY